jgi:hypothetical protein
MMPKKSLAVVVTLLASAANAAAQDDVARMMSNDIGLVAHCTSLGFVDEKAALSATDKMRAALKALGGAQDATLEAEEAGRNGLWGTSKLPIADRAALFDQSVEEYCAELVAGL